MRIEVASKSKTIQYYPRIAALLRSIWPPVDPAFTIDKQIAALRSQNKGRFERSILLFDGEEIIGYALVFKRIILCGGRAIRNMALSSVCVSARHQGRGVGKLLVQRTFAFVDDGTFECSLFQTRVPDFYLRLGARVIDNVVIDSTSNVDRPFADPFIMLYPKKFRIGAGQIDLNGFGY